MGRLGTMRARLVCTLAFLVLHPLACWLSNALTSDGTPSLSLVVGLTVAYLLSVGPRGGVAVAAAMLLDALVFGGLPLTSGLVLVMVAKAAVAVGAVAVLEARFRHHGRVRRPIVVVEFGVVAAVVLPLLLEAVGALAGAWLGYAASSSSLLHRAVSDGLGVLTVTAGLRMLVMGERIRVGRRAAYAIAGASSLTTTAVLVTAGFGGVDRLADAQILLVPVLVLALRGGTAAFSLGMLATTLAVLVPLALVVEPGELQVSLFSHASWWFVVFVGLVLAADGDRRRQVAAEFRTLFERSGTPTAEVNLGTGQIALANAALAQLVGQSPDTLVGRSVLDLLPDEEAHDHLDRVLSGTEDEWSGECNLVAADGPVRWVRGSAVRVDVGGPQPDVLQVQFVDLTQQRDRQAALERSNQALEAFGRRVTHDLKQPLTAIAGYASTLRERGERLDPATVATMHERLDAVARRAVTQLDDTFRSASLPTGAMTDVMLHEIVASVGGVVDIDLAEAGGAVYTSLAVQRLQADPSMLRQVLLNLITNSLKYARPDVPPRIRVASRIRGAGIELTVTDNGVGVPVDALEQVFERGLRLAPDAAGGRGDGLADSRDLAEAAGGWLRAEPWPDGARFVLWLPDARVVGAAPPTRVLLVGSDPDARRVLVERLDPEATLDLVGTVASIEDAVERTRALRPDVILLDRWLADGDGLDALVELARAHADVRILLLTADGNPEVDRLARSGGVLQTVDKGSLDIELMTGLERLSS